MEHLDLNSSTADAFVRRIEAITSPDQRRWGTLDPAPLMRHLTYVFEVSLNERPREKLFVPMPGFVAWQLFFVWFTKWPEGKIKAPESFMPEGDGELEEERAHCIAALHRFLEALSIDPDQKGYSPLLGNIPLRRWARVHGVHLNHHLRQYGV
jgi:hypothetical protein